MNPKETISHWRQSSETSDAVLLAEPKFREQIYRTLHPTPSKDDRKLLLYCLGLEMGYRDNEPNGDYFENLYWCALLLYQIGVAEDALAMWRAKHVNFDTGCGFDVQFLVGAGVDQTLGYLAQSGDPDATNAHEYIVQCRETGDFDNLDAWRAGRVGYFK